MGPSWLKILVVVALVLVLFGGRGKISGLMGDFAKGLRSFRKNLRDGDADEARATAAASATDGADSDQALGAAGPQTTGT